MPETEKSKVFKVGNCTDGKDGNEIHEERKKRRSKKGGERRDCGTKKEKEISRKIEKERHRKESDVT